MADYTYENSQGKPWLTPAVDMDFQDKWTVTPTEDHGVAEGQRGPQQRWSVNVDKGNGQTLTAGRYEAMDDNNVPKGRFGRALQVALEQECGVEITLAKTRQGKICIDCRLTDGAEIGAGKPAQAKATAKTAPRPQPARSNGGGWDDPVRQELIMRQSCIASAARYAGPDTSEGDLFALAERILAWVKEPMADEPEDEEPEPEPEPAKLISKVQETALRAAIKMAEGVTLKSVKAYMLENFKVGLAKELTVPQYDQLMDWVERTARGEEDEDELPF